MKGIRKKLKGSRAKAPLIHRNDDGKASCGRPTIVSGGTNVELTDDEVTCIFCINGWVDVRSNTRTHERDLEFEDFDGSDTEALTKGPASCRVSGLSTFTQDRPILSISFNLD